MVGRHQWADEPDPEHRQRARHHADLAEPVGELAARERREQDEDRDAADMNPATGRLKPSTSVM
jgi:hypothetical protein